ncbi:MAG: hypothetical protein AB1642_11715 [Pseudomonadota bacterium]
MRRLTIALLWAVTLGVAAQEAQEATGGPAELATPEQLEARADALRRQAGEIRGAAEQAHAAAQKTCWDKFLVSACLDDAKDALRAAGREAKALEVEAGKLKRQSTALKRERRERQRIEEAPQRAAESARRAEEIRRKEAEAVQRMADKQADIERRQREQR